VATENESVIIITRGEKVEFDIFLEKTTLPRPFDLTNFDLFKVVLPTSSGTPLVLTETINANGSIVEKITPDVLGHLKVTIFPEDSALLEPAFGQDIDLEWDNDASPNTKRKRLHKVLHVEDSLA
jgi:hypothetical protein